MDMSVVFVIFTIAKVIVFLCAGVIGIYAMLVLIKALKIYIKKNS
ncbi:MULTISPECIES: hypothetical protein [Clostridium]|nr:MULTISPECIES: hypothetical protein [Clostridium]